MASSGLKRKNNEQYYTKEIIAEQLIEKLNKIYPLIIFDKIIEPSAGNGSFLKHLNKYNNNNILAYDIDPKYENIIKKDFLTTSYDTSLNYLVIGNPPFGRQSSLAKKFIKHSCSFASVIAFILPRSFRKESMYNSFDLNYHNVYEENVPNNSFILDNKEYDVPCLFQVWEYKKGITRNISVKIIENKNYQIISQDDNPTFAFRRVGVYAGTFIFDNIDSLSHQSHYFIKVKDNYIISQTLLQNIQWDQDNTIGPKSISKQELIKNLNNIII
jgi:predicted RNA methylase